MQHEPGCRRRRICNATGGRRRRRCWKFRAAEGLDCAGSLFFYRGEGYLGKRVGVVVFGFDADGFQFDTSVLWIKIIILRFN